MQYFLAQCCHVYMGVYLCGAYGFVPQQSLNDAKVGTSL